MLSIKGDLSYRILKNYSRLESKWYKPEIVFNADESGWPGDWEGRTILALVLLAQATGREPAYLDRILVLLKGQLNEKGYLKRIYPSGLFDEQQFSGHNWLLRGLLEYYIWKKDESVREMILKIIYNLYLPAKDYYQFYPTDPKDRSYDGKMAGELTGSIVGHWYTSSDIGCAYMCFDALSQAYKLFRTPEMGDMLEKMFQYFTIIDFKNTGMQTHATLTAARGILRLYRNRRDKRYLDFVTELFQLYREEAMTENYANYNWFGRPLWTEPCAIVDSYILAAELYFLTKESFYMEIANKIYYNAIGYAQRLNGGFGCDTCAGPENLIITPNGLPFGEAYWCCTMRGAEGLSAVRNYSVVREKDILRILHHHQMHYRDAMIDLYEEPKYPEEGEIFLCGTAVEDQTLILYMPTWANIQLVDGVPYSHEQNEMWIFLNKGDFHITITFCVPLIKQKPIGKNTRKDVYSLWHGDLMLGIRTADIINLNDRDVTRKKGSCYLITGTEYELNRIDGNIDLEYTELDKLSTQVLFH
ncbi:MAG: glycoside hydrolase family 127 protein [Clostridiales bacterium]|nr:glycoside hydrolase family 127 protein [Clostridiales bacterium]